MSFYGYTPVRTDYSFVERAGQQFGQAAGAIVDGVAAHKADKQLQMTLDEERNATVEIASNRIEKMLDAGVDLQSYGIDPTTAGEGSTSDKARHIVEMNLPRRYKKESDADYRKRLEARNNVLLDAYQRFNAGAFISDMRAGEAGAVGTAAPEERPPLGGTEVAPRQESLGMLSQGGQEAPRTLSLPPVQGSPLSAVAAGKREERQISPRTERLYGGNGKPAEELPESANMAAHEAGRRARAEAEVRNEVKPEAKALSPEELKDRLYELRAQDPAHFNNEQFAIIEKMLDGRLSAKAAEAALRREEEKEAAKIEREERRRAEDKGHDLTKQGNQHEHQATEGKANRESREKIARINASRPRSSGGSGSSSGDYTQNINRTALQMAQNEGIVETQSGRVVFNRNRLNEIEDPHAAERARRNALELIESQRRNINTAQQQGKSTGIEDVPKYLQDLKEAEQALKTWTPQESQRAKRERLMAQAVKEWDNLPRTTRLNPLQNKDKWIAKRVQELMTGEKK